MTSPGMSTYGSPVTSWRISSIGNSGARSSGPTGCCVPGCSGGGGGAGRSGMTLYHWRGISDSSSVILVRSVTTASQVSSHCVYEKFALCKNPLWLLAAHLHRSLAQAPKACTRESVLHNAHCPRNVFFELYAPRRRPPKHPPP